MTPSLRPSMKNISPRMTELSPSAIDAAPATLSRSTSHWKRKRKRPIGATPLTCSRTRSNV
jgi:hypothetical protein